MATVTAERVRMSKRIIIYVVIAVIGLGAFAAVQYFAMNPVDSGGPNITFLDDVQTNSQTEAKLTDFQFTDPQGDRFSLGDLLVDRHLVVVVLRGNTGSVCPYCSTQTSRLISNYDEFTKRGAEVVVIYPVEKEEDRSALDNFLKVTRERLLSSETAVPFPLVLDVGLEAVDQLGLRAFLSKPATYILDKQGNVRFAYVGSSLADRPSIKAMLEQVDALNG